MAAWLRAGHDGWTWGSIPREERPPSAHPARATRGLRQKQARGLPRTSRRPRPKPSQSHSAAGPQDPTSPPRHERALTHPFPTGKRAGRCRRAAPHKSTARGGWGGSCVGNVQSQSAGCLSIRGPLPRGCSEAPPALSASLEGEELGCTRLPSSGGTGAGKCLEAWKDPRRAGVAARCHRPEPSSRDCMHVSAIGELPSGAHGNPGQAHAGGRRQEAAAEPTTAAAHRLRGIEGITLPTVVVSPPPRQHQPH